MNQYFPNDVEEIRRKMLNTIGVSDVESLFSDIPEKARLKKPLNLPSPLSETETMRAMESILKKNWTVKNVLSFLGGGVWPHFIPAIVDDVSKRAEFLTSYTPYQPEINQGLLQALFEYQSLICEISGMDVANCSMYDWASSLGEAARMAARITGRSDFLVPHFISPDRLTTLSSFSEPAGVNVVEYAQNMENGQVNLEDLKNKVSQKTAGVYLENPSYLGFLLEDVEKVSEIVHDLGGLFVVGINPISLGILKPPGEYGADIVIGEGQPLGNYMNFGGPLLGIFACKGEPEFIRQIPGRIVGMTMSMDGKERGFCLVLQTREQHIRREKATSNICTNEALCALRSAVYMAALGKTGFRELAETILSMSSYTMKLLSELEGVRVPFFEAPHFDEFTVNFDGTGKDVEDVNQKLLQQGILGGKSLRLDFPDLGHSALYCVTELHTKKDIELLQITLKQILEG